MALVNLVLEQPCPIVGKHVWSCKLLPPIPAGGRYHHNTLCHAPRDNKISWDNKAWISSDNQKSRHYQPCPHNVKISLWTFTLFKKKIWSSPGLIHTHQVQFLMWGSVWNLETKKTKRKQVLVVGSKEIFLILCVVHQQVITQVVPVISD